MPRHIGSSVVVVGCIVLDVVAPAVVVDVAPAVVVVVRGTVDDVVGPAVVVVDVVWMHDPHVVKHSARMKSYTQKVFSKL